MPLGRGGDVERLSRRDGLVEHARGEVRVALGDGYGGVAQHFAQELEAPGLAPPAHDERTRAAVSEIVPAHVPTIVTPESDVQLRALEDAGPASRLLTFRGRALTAEDMERAFEWNEWQDSLRWG